MGELTAAGVLTVVGEISIAIVGFTGIVVVYRQRGIEALRPHERYRLRFMLAVACTTLFFALLPFVPHYLGLAEATTWMLASAALGAGLIVLRVVVHITSRAIRGDLSRLWYRIYEIGDWLFAALLIASVAGVSGAALPGVYVAALGWLVFFSVTLFVRLIVSPAPGA